MRRLEEAVVAQVCSIGSLWLALELKIVALIATVCWASSEVDRPGREELLDMRPL